MSIDVFKMMAKYPNICRYVHLPIQSGSDAMLRAMNRQHTRQQYLDLIKEAKLIVPDIAFSQDIMVGFSGETEADHQDTLSLMKEVAICLPTPNGQAPQPTKKCQTTSPMR